MAGSQFVCRIKILTAAVSHTPLEATICWNFEVNCKKDKIQGDVEEKIQIYATYFHQFTNLTFNYYILSIQPLNSYYNNGNR